METPETREIENDENDLPQVDVEQIIPTKNDIPLGVPYALKTRLGNSIGVYFTFDLGIRGKGLIEAVEEIRKVIGDNSVSFMQIAEKFINMVRESLKLQYTDEHIESIMEVAHFVPADLQGIYLAIITGIPQITLNVIGEQKKN